MNPKIYIHEFIDIIGHNRAKYMHHMTANWVPVGIEERNMRCFGVWATVGSTGRWPEVVNMWELDGWDGLAANFAHETAGGRDQDPSLAGMAVILVSARTQRADLQAGYDAGADEYVTKPFSPNALAATVRKWVSRGAAG